MRRTKKGRKGEKKRRRREGTKQGRAGRGEGKQARGKERKERRGAQGGGPTKERPRTKSHRGRRTSREGWRCSSVVECLPSVHHQKEVKRNPRGVASPKVRG